MSGHAGAEVLWNVGGCPRIEAAKTGQNREKREESGRGKGRGAVRVSGAMPAVDGADVEWRWAQAVALGRRLGGCRCNAQG